MEKQYIPSKVTPGKHFSIDIYKPQGRPAMACATEGTYTKLPSGNSSFEYEMPGARMARVTLSGNNTAKNRREAVLALLGEMTDKDWIYPGELVNVT